MVYFICGRYDKLCHNSAPECTDSKYKTGGAGVVKLHTEVNCCGHLGIFFIRSQIFFMPLEPFFPASTVPLKKFATTAKCQTPSTALGGFGAAGRLEPSVASRQTPGGVHLAKHQKGM